MFKSNHLRRVLLAIVAGAWLGMCYGVMANSAPDISDPCYSPEHGRILPPLYGDDC